MIIDFRPKTRKGWHRFMSRHLWHTWFAWRPVVMDRYWLVWLRRIERRIVEDSAGVERWEYRLP